jgi:LAS superfamily LD-carboxypeptidase LdcB
LPKNHDYKANMMVFPSEYKWYSQAEVYRKIDKDMWPYLKAMIDACRADIGTKEIGIISAWRDYGTQVTLYEAQVKKWKDKGYAQEAAEKEAASRVAIPGTSEHHTGLAVDFNSTQTSFEESSATSVILRLLTVISAPAEEPTMIAALAAVLNVELEIVRVVSVGF